MCRVVWYEEQDTWSAQQAELRSFCGNDGIRRSALVLLNLQKQSGIPHLTYAQTRFRMWPGLDRQLLYLELFSLAASITLVLLIQVFYISWSELTCFICYVCCRWPFPGADGPRPSVPVHSFGRGSVLSDIRYERLSNHRQPGGARELHEQSPSR